MQLPVLMDLMSTALRFSKNHTSCLKRMNSKFVSATFCVRSLGQACLFQNGVGSVAFLDI